MTPLILRLSLPSGARPTSASSQTCPVCHLQDCERPHQQLTPIQVRAGLLLWLVQGKGLAKKSCGAMSTISATVNAARMAKRHHHGPGAGGGGGSGGQGGELQRSASRSAHQSFADRGSQPTRGLVTSQSSKLQRAESGLSLADRCVS